MGSKRKNAPSSTTCSWDDMKVRLQSIECGNWVMQWKECKAIVVNDADKSLRKDCHNNNGVMGDIVKELEETSSQIKESLQTQIDMERQVLAAESDDLYDIVQKTNELQSQVSEQTEQIAQLEQLQIQLRDSIHNQKQVASKHVEEMDHVEFELMQQVPKIKSQISLYAKTTGIKWDYHRDHVLAGQVSIPSRGVVSRFSIDPREYDSFQIANYLWSAMEGNVDPDIRVT